jgi:hypothetical protein
VGESQSAFLLTTYANGIQPIANQYDAFLIHSRGGGAAPLGEPDAGIALLDAILGDPILIRGDLAVPILVLETETDVLYLLGYQAARQPDTDRLRAWDGPPPPTADLLQVDGADHARDADGIALGGIRTPLVDVPLDTLSGAPQQSAIACTLFGSTTPLSADRVAELYASPEAYLDAYAASADATVEAGFVLDDDRDALMGRASRRDKLVRDGCPKDNGGMLLRFATTQASLVALTLVALALAAACSSRVRDDGPGGSGCEPVTCTLHCENGFAIGPDGCETCACDTPACPGSNPAGCVVTGCPEGSTCDQSRGCVSSSCSCDESSGSWLCTDDCGGGTCVPSSECRGPDPSGCSSKGCPAGQICDQGLGCFPSGCACDPSSGGWGCTADCGGGVCRPDPAGCNAPDPTGCMLTGCPLDQICTPTSGLCVPSWCTCDQQTGTWACTDDCGGGKCADP